MNRIWIRNGDTIRSNPLHSVMERGEDMLKAIFGNGPMWSPGIYIDVVLKISFNGTSYYLLAENQFITKTM